MSVSYEKKEKYSIDDLLRIMEILRSEEGCPWDREQTHPSMRRDMIEEAYEVCEAIDLNDTDLLKEELGDVLLQVLFHTDIERAAGRFDLNDVCDAECKKLIFRHPFLFGGEAESWDELKQKEKGQKTTGEAMAGVARSLPATWRAEKIQKKAAKTGFRCSGSPAGTGRTGTSCGSTADTAAAGCGNTGTGTRQPHCSFQQCPVEYGSGVHRPAAGIGK